MFSIAKTAIDTQYLRSQLSDDRAGALVEFEGRVRNHNEGSTVLTLEYEAAESLAVAEANRIFAEVKEKFAIYDAICVHRQGLLQIGETAVYVGVISAHRSEAFAACRYIIDEIKHRLPIWKKETYSDGRSEWVNCQHINHEHAH
ncbi:MAG: molybdenum cofactor biosynthesis protein MoaE [Candidatus Obscuribacter sp.]|nr:molybdenum cofactor biosynthesis protein MoaE [Candidatus Obscuribacter sp.]